MQAINIIFDTNVLIANHPDFRDFVSDLLDEISTLSDELSDSDFERPAIRLALDEEGEIKREYIEQVLHQEHNRISRTSNLRRLYELIKRLPENSPLIEQSSGALPDEELTFLKSVGCDRPVEPSIFGIAHRSYNSPDPVPTFVYLTTEFALPKGVFRGYPEVYPMIGPRYLPNNDHYREVLKTMLDSGPRPETWLVVDRIISSIRACGGAPMEGERHEFKGTTIQPHKATDTKTDTGILPKEVWDDLPKTVCSMLNKDGGYIFLGVREKPTFEVTGFNWRENHDSPGEEHLALVHKLESSIFPFDPEKIRAYIVTGIPDSIVPADKMMIAIQVKRKSRDDPYYRASGYTGKKGKSGEDKRKKHQRAVWIRCGSQVLLKPEQE